MDVKPSLGDNKCWSHEGKYVGKLVRLEHVGRTFDLDPKYTFETGDVVIGLGEKFTEVPCRSGGGGSIEMTSLSNATNSSSNATNSSSNATSASSAPVGFDLFTLLGAEFPNVELILQAIKNGADVNTPDRKGYTPLFWAASKGLTEVVAALIARHVDLNAKTTGSGNTALMVACLNGFARIAMQLIMAGADLHIKNNSSKTAMSVLIEHLARYASPSQQPKDLRQVQTLLEQRGAGRRRHMRKSRKGRKQRLSKKSRRSTSRKVKADE